MSVHTRDQIIEIHKLHATRAAERALARSLKSQARMYPPEYVVWAWDGAPPEVRQVCDFNGGDEDWLVVRRGTPDPLPLPPRWIECMDSCHDPDVYLFLDLTVFVGKHA